MFNPKQALQRIRRTKHQKQQVKQISEGVQPLFATPEQFQPRAATVNNIEDRVSKLQMMVMRLTDQLSHSNQTVEKLKKENSSLQTQILKLQYENSQLKTTQMYSQIRKNSSTKKIIAQSITQHPQTQPQAFQPSISYLSKQRRGQTAQLPVIPAQKQKYSIQVEQIIENIKNEPIENILKKKEHQFRARKPDQKQVLTGNKYLRELAMLEKEYGKSMRKPVLVIKLDDEDFQ